MPKVSPSVLIIRLDGIGDALALTPLIAALHRRSIPLDIVLRKSNAGIFASRAARKVVTADFQLRSSAKSNLAQVVALGRTLRAQEYSHVLVATEDLTGYRLARAVAAPVRIGFTNGWGKPLKSLWSRGFLTKRVFRSAGLDARAPNECEVLFRLAAPLTGDEKPTRDVTQLRPLVLENEPEADERIAVQITEKWRQLGIATSELVDLVRRLAGSGELHLLSAQTENVYAEPIAEATGLPVSYFGDLGEWKAAIGAATALVAPDSGAIHVAGMIGTPVVAVFPAGRTYGLQAARWAPWAAPHRIVDSREGWPLRTADAVANLLSIA